MKIEDPRYITKLSAVALAFFSAGIFVFSAGNASANNFGTEITIYDGIGTGSGPYREDNEAEPGMVQSQAWDLEGFFQKGNKITIVGGYNFYTVTEGMSAGDIFIGTTRKTVYSSNFVAPTDWNPDNTVSNTYFKYDYVVHINWSSSTYDIIKLHSDSILENTFYGSAHNVASNPWIWVSGGEVVAGATNLTIDDPGILTDTQTGFDGWGTDTHYAAIFDLSSISSVIKIGTLFHNTMECGNDNLLGVDPVPEPATMLLFGTGLAGLGYAGARRKTKA